MTSPLRRRWDEFRHEARALFTPVAPPCELPLSAVPLAALAYLGIDGLFAQLFHASKDNPTQLLYSRLVSAPVLIVVLLSLLKFVRFSPSSCLGMQLQRVPSAFRYGVWFAILAVPVMLVLNVFVRVAIPDGKTHPALVLFENAGPTELTLIFVNAVVLAPLAEELFFRGILQNGLMSVLAPGPAVAIAGIIFGFAHLGAWPDPIPLSFLGILLGLSLTRTGTLWTPIFFHASFNGLMLALAFTQSDTTK